MTVTEASRHADVVTDADALAGKLAGGLDGTTVPWQRLVMRRGENERPS